MRKTSSMLNYLSVIFVFSFTLFVFRGYLVGETVPPWDFFGAYYTQAYSWWDLGSFFNPTTYLPYLISGYPSHLGLQFSSYYLPVGLVAEIANYTIVNAARLQALTIAFGIVGVFLFARRWNLSNGSAIVASIGYLFTAGFFSNASHIDIVRAWSFFPWLLLSLSPVKIIKWWMIPASILLWFQFFVGAYPGNIVSFAYLFSFYCMILFWQNKDKIRPLVIWYAMTIIPGLLMSSLKWIPFLVSANGPQMQNQVKVNLGIFSTIFFPYGGTGIAGDTVLPNDLTQRTFFVIPLIIFLAAFARNNKFLVPIGFTFLFGSILLGIDFPIFAHWQEFLPLLDISRFRTIDFKPGISFSLALLAGVGLDNIVHRKAVFPNFYVNKKEYLQYLIVATVTFSALMIGREVGFSEKDVNQTYSWLLISITSIAALFVLKRINFLVASHFLIIFALCYLGLGWANSFKDPWQMPRLPIESFFFHGKSSDELISEQQEKLLKSRPQRLGPALPIPYPGQMIVHVWDSLSLKRIYSTGGYVRLRGVDNFQKYIEYALDSENHKIIEFLQQESQIKLVDLKTSSIDECFSSDNCEFGKINYDFEQYGPGNFKLNIEKLLREQTVIVNEIGWRGWEATACLLDGSCKKISVGSESENLLLNAKLPANTVFVEFEYKTPYITISWIIFGIAFFLGLIGLIFLRQINVVIKKI